MPRRQTALTPLFAATLFTSAALLFWVEPMVAKMLLPLLGGTPAVWNTCLLFFQTMLLAGYAYALFASRRFSLRQQAAAQLLLLVAAAVVTFPVSVPAAAAAGVPQEGNPAPWLLARLALMVGLPFFAVSTLGPLLQRWFAATRHAAARDPYFLYAASNAGSLLALLGYPLVLEPLLTLRAQSRLWSYAYALLALLVALCAAAVWRAGGRAPAESETGGDAAGPGACVTGEGSADAGREAGAAGRTSPVTAARRLLWVALALVPSSLMMGVTTYISTDIASLPLLWVIPLGLYLLTLVIAFARRRVARRWWVEFTLPGVALVFFLAYLSGATQPVWFLVFLHLLFFFVTSLMCHGRLADDRPATAHLAEFYLWTAVGGALGGLFNALVAPLVFSSVVEYPLAAVAACALLPRRRGESKRAATAEGPLTLRIAEATRLDPATAHDEAAELESAAEPYTTAGPHAPAVPGATAGPDATAESGALPRRDAARSRWLDFGFAAALGLFSVLLALIVTRAGFELEWLEGLALVSGLPLVLVYLLRRRPLRFALALGAVALAGNFNRSLSTETLHTERNFFGTLRVTHDAPGRLRWLYHGTTIHGRQSTRPDKQCEPLSYYHKTGPLGSVFAAYNARPASPNVAVVGLGTGATAAYARPGQRWTFYEINPAVVRLTETPEHFSYLQYCANDATVGTVLGDARLRLADAEPSAYGLIVLDAFSSDAIPVHLMTLEALDLYLSKLAPGGVVVFHISNRSLNLQPVVADLALARSLSGALSRDATRHEDKETSYWVALARRPEDLDGLTTEGDWQALAGEPARRVWTDDFSNIVSILK